MITVRKNPYGDTRAVPKGIKVEFADFQEANDSHRHEVGEVMFKLSQMMDERGEQHDFTKKMQERMFYKDFQDALANGNNFTESEWYQMHIHAERHHLNSYCPEDVNLIDVLEMVADCVCAGLARNNKPEVRPIEISNDILQRAIGNTVEMITKMITVEGENK